MCGQVSARRWTLGESHAEFNTNVEKYRDLEVLGRHVAQSPEGIYVDQWGYLKKMTPVPISKARRQCGDSPLVPSDMAQYLSLVQQLAWPPRSTLPGLCFGAGPPTANFGSNCIRSRPSQLGPAEGEGDGRGSS